MEQISTDEVLQQRVADLEKKLKEYEQEGIVNHLHEVTKRLEKVTEMGDAGIIVFDDPYRIACSDPGFLFIHFFSERKSSIVSFNLCSAGGIIAAILSFFI